MTPVLFYLMLVSITLKFNFPKNLFTRDIDEIAEFILVPKLSRLYPFSLQNSALVL